MHLQGVHISDERLHDLCRRHGVSRLALYGSILRDDFAPESDIDVLVEYPIGQTPSLLDLGGLLMELRELFGREVDLKTPGFLSPHFRDEVQRIARTLYAA